MEQVGRYRLLAPVARGGVGEVWRARAPDGSEVALKRLLAGGGADEVQRRRFATEARAQLRLRHPHLVALLDAGEEQGVPYLVLEWVEGETLAAHLDRHGPLEPRAAAALVRRLALALAHCHAQGVLHRDLKPENVLLRAGRLEAPLLTDFGLAKDQASSLSGPGTLSGQFLGTPSYWPPEQARGDLAAIGPRSDVYGLGAILHAALTGVPPHRQTTLGELLAVIDRPLPPPSALRPGIPPWLDEACAQALDPDPAGRPASAADLAATLAAGAPAPPRRSRWPLALAASSAVLLGGGLWHLARTRREAAESSPDARAVALVRRGAELRGEHQPAAAIAVLDQALALDPASALAWFERGSARDDQGDHRGALSDLNRALELDPSRAAYWTNRAIARWGLGDRSGACQDLDRALALDPDQPEGLNTRGAVRLELGDFEGAQADLDRAIALSPRTPYAHYNRARLRRKQGDLQGALDDLDRAIALGPSEAVQQDALILQERAGLRMMLGDAGGAREDCDRALELLPADAGLLVARSIARESAGDQSGALDDLDRAVRADETNVVARGRRASLRRALGDPAGALQDLDRALELDARCVPALTDRGALREALGDDAGALADYDHALEIDDRRGEVFFNRGALHARTGRLEQARSDLERALALEPGAPWATSARAGLAQLRGVLGRPKLPAER